MYTIFLTSLKKIKIKNKIKKKIKKGNKCDMEFDEKEVNENFKKFCCKYFKIQKEDTKEGKSINELLPNKIKLPPIIYTSAKLRKNIDESFHELVRECRKFTKNLEKKKPDGDKKITTNTTTTTTTTTTTKVKNNNKGLFSSLSGKEELQQDIDLVKKTKNN
jgi:hypothetical protein